MLPPTCKTQLLFAGIVLKPCAFWMILASPSLRSAKHVQALPHQKNKNISKKKKEGGSSHDRHGTSSPKLPSGGTSTPRAQKKTERRACGAHVRALPRVQLQAGAAIGPHGSWLGAGCGRREGARGCQRSFCSENQQNPRGNSWPRKGKTRFCVQDGPLIAFQSHHVYHGGELLGAPLLDFQLQAGPGNWAVRQWCLSLMSVALSAPSPPQKTARLRPSKHGTTSVTRWPRTRDNLETTTGHRKPVPHPMSATRNRVSGSRAFATSHTKPKV